MLGFVTNSTNVWINFANIQPFWTPFGRKVLPDKYFNSVDPDGPKHNVQTTSPVRIQDGGKVQLDYTRRARVAPKDLFVFGTLAWRHLTYLPKVIIDCHRLPRIRWFVASAHGTDADGRTEGRTNRIFYEPPYTKSPFGANMDNLWTLYKNWTLSDQFELSKFSRIKKI